MVRHAPRKPYRFKSYDYSQPGAYFVTICTWNHQALFGQITHDMMILNPLGVVADRYWRSIPEHFSNVVLGTYVIMPNHVHGIIQIVEPDRLEAAQRAAPLQQPAPQQQNNPTDRNDPMPGSLGVIVRGFKSALTKFAHGIPAYDGLRIWQRNFYDHIIRDKNDWERVHAYIITNPHRCILDRDSLDTLDD